MEYAAIHHDMDKRFCYALDKGRFLIRIETKKGDMQKIILHCQDKYIPAERMDTHFQMELLLAASDRYKDYYEAELTFDMVCLRYFFELTDTAGQCAYYGNYAFFDHRITDVDDMFDCPQNLREEERFLVPSWAENKVVYQIFPSRFASSRPVRDSLWYKAPIGSGDDLHGDLRGIIEHLDHMQSLGVDVLYMTPIFRSNSSHKYDTIDYYTIDPSFGTKEDLKELVEKAHERGMKVILDGVFNHTAPEFFAFADIRQKEAQSPYLDWYFIEGFPLRAKRGERPNFKTFSYFGGMPKLNLKNPDVERYITEVALYWLRECGIDGWRLDVADEISHRFWKHFRQAVKQEFPEALLIGEIWHYAGDFLEGDEWDTVMNYPFYQNVTELVAKESISVSQFAENAGFMKGRIHTKVYPALWNLLDSHDTPRFLHTCGYDKRKQRLAAALQLLSPGMPMICYGDEYAIGGGNDPDCRRGMLWQESHQDREMYLWYRNLIRIRKKYPFILTEKPIASRFDDEAGLMSFTYCGTDGASEMTLLFHSKEGMLSLPEYVGRTDILSGKTFYGVMDAYAAAVLL